MANNKRKPARKSPKKRPTKTPIQGLPHRRSLEGTVRQFVSGLKGRAQPDTPLGRAQNLIYDAFEESDPERRVQLAEQALAVCSDCADAYTLLAEHAASRKEALRLYEEGVAASERALGREAFKRDVGSFWGLLETRPYMRARLGLAHALWSAARRDEAVAHLQDMLRLNPNDNQGVRYIVAAFLLFLDRDDDLSRLLDQYDEDSATWAYTRALLAFRRHGDTIDTRRLLKAARKANKYVPPYITGRKFPPAETPPYYRLGDDSEAVQYISAFLASWNDTPGAVAWLRQNTAPKKATRRPAPQGPSELVTKRLAQSLPQQEDVWQAGFRQTPDWIADKGETFRPWVILIASRSTGMIVGMQMSHDAPSAALLWDTLEAAMQHPTVGGRSRPVEVQAEPDPRWEDLRPHLEAIGVRLVTNDRLNELRGLFQEMAEQIGGGREPGLLDTPGVTPAQAGSFYEAAAFFFREAPWKKIGYEAPIRIECDKFQGGPSFGVVMGQSGLSRGLALYQRLPQLRNLLRTGENGQEAARQTVGISVTFGEEWTVPAADVDAAKAHGWIVARPDAYPHAFRKEVGFDLQPPLASELNLLDACLRAVPQFVTLRRQDDPGRETMKVSAASGERKLVLSWVTEEEM